jgi:2Fe-2S ferredoxin
METARQNNVAGVLAQCGGACACATCHVYVAPEWSKRLPLVDEMEAAMLENVWEPRQTSRLSCQITVSDAMDGLTVAVPERQA